MNTIFFLLSVQAVMGAFDNLWHHELQAKLPQRISARYELALQFLEAHVQILSGR